MARHVSLLYFFFLSIFFLLFFRVLLFWCYFLFWYFNRLKHASVVLAPADWLELAVCFRKLAAVCISYRSTCSFWLSEYIFSSTILYFLLSTLLARLVYHSNCLSTAVGLCLFVGMCKDAKDCAFELCFFRESISGKQFLLCQEWPKICLPKVRWRKISLNFFMNSINLTVSVREESFFVFGYAG